MLKESIRFLWLVKGHMSLPCLRNSVAVQIVITESWYHGTHGTGNPGLWVHILALGQQRFVCVHLTSEKHTDAACYNYRGRKGEYNRR